MGRLAIMVKKVAKGGAAPKIDFPRSAVVAKKRTFSIGGDVLPQNRDLTRFVRWPKYVRLQRSKMTLLKRIKIPPAINQFSNTFDQRQRPRCSVSSTTSSLRPRLRRRSVSLSRPRKLPPVARLLPRSLLP